MTPAFVLINRNYGEARMVKQLRNSNPQMKFKIQIHECNPYEGQLPRHLDSSDEEGGEICEQALCWFLLEKSANFTPFVDLSAQSSAKY